MGLSESKVPFEDEGDRRTPKIEKEIGICPMWDPRSPSTDFERTPVLYRNKGLEILDDDIGSVACDPRSPSSEVKRTPLGADYNDTSVENDEYREFRVQLERLHIFDGGVHNITASSENLGNYSESIEAVTQQRTVLKLLDDVNTQDNSLWLPNTPPCPKSRSTPGEVTPNSPETPETCKNETDGLVKRRKPSTKKQYRSSQKGEKLQKKVLKKAVGEQTTRSPLAERNGMISKDGKSRNGKAKSTGFVKYRKYNSLNESLNDSFSGKENEHIVW